MTQHTNNLYYVWLVSQVAVSGGKTYNETFDIMHATEFQWTVANDDNRVQDGLDLRTEFMGDHNGEITLLGVSFLEVMIGLSRRLAFIAGGEAPKWAWHLMKNIRLRKYSDPLSHTGMRRVSDILDTVIWRQYHPDGRGGFFPLQNPSEDQTKVELWYQLNSYVIEMKSV